MDVYTCALCVPDEAHIEHTPTRSSSHLETRIRINVYAWVWIIQQYLLIL